MWKGKETTVHKEHKEEVKKEGKKQKTRYEEPDHGVDPEGREDGRGISWNGPDHP